jgi:hypothetical protein
MTVGDLPSASATQHPQEPPRVSIAPVPSPSARPGAEPAVVRPGATWSERRRQHSRRESARTFLAAAFAVAWITCPLIEPTPNGPEPAYQLWLLPIHLAAVVTIVAAVAALSRGSRHAAPIGIAAGLLMCVETALCPGTGHHLMGTFIWVQTGLSLFVLLTSCALPALGLVPGPRRPPNR